MQFLAVQHKHSFSLSIPDIYDSDTKLAVIWMALCVHVCTHVYACSCVCRYTHVYGSPHAHVCGGEWSTSGIVPHVQSNFSFGKKSSLVWGSLIQLCWMSSKPLRYLCLHIYSTGITSLYHYAQLLLCGSGDQTQVPLPARQAIYWLYLSTYLSIPGSFF